jgi:hypothetical protein
VKRQETPGDRRLSPGEDGIHVASAVPLDLSGGCRRNRSSAFGQRPQPALHEVGAEIRKQQHTAEQEEGDDQDRRDEAHEDVRDDQLPANAPQQPAFDEGGAADEKVTAPGGDDHRGHAVEHVDGCRRRRCDETQELDGNLDRQADDNRPSRQRSKQGVLHQAILHAIVGGS